MLIKAIKSRIITSGDELLKTIINALGEEVLREGDILVITSKVVAITQGKIVKIPNEQVFQAFVRKEADKVLSPTDGMLTLKNNIFIPWAGIDRSNIKKGYAVLWPENPFKIAANLQKALRKSYKLQKLGVMIIDSWCAPRRKGVNAITLGYAGFKGVNDLRGKKDLHGNKLNITQQNIADMLAASANLIMGESNEATPFALIQGAPITFTNKQISASSLIMESKTCLYAPLYKNVS